MPSFDGESSLLVSVNDAEELHRHHNRSEWDYPKTLLLMDEPTIMRSMEYDYDVDDEAPLFPIERDHQIVEDFAQYQQPAAAADDGKSETRLTRSQVGLIAMMCFVNYCNFVCYSLIAPFFPKEVVKKGGSQAIASWVFGSYELTVFLVCPIFGKHIGHLGTRFLFVCGTCVTGAACALFGLLSMVDQYPQFVALAFSTRIVEAVGAGAYLTASFCIAANEFPTRVATIQGFLETASGLGISTGPTVGGALYAAGGYFVPFATMGTVLVLAGSASFFMLPPSTSASVRSRSSQSVWSLLKIPGVVLSALSIISGAMSIGFYEPTLELHIDRFIDSPVHVGLVFLASAGTYALGSPIWGAAADRMKNPKLLMAFGCVVVGVAFILMGPAPFLGIKLELWMIIVALLIHGIGIGAQLVPPLRDILTEAFKNGFHDDVNTRGLSCGLFASMFSLGAFLGPVIGGSLIDVISFEWSAFVISCLNFLLAIILFGHLLLSYRKTRARANFYEPLAGAFVGTDD